MIAAEREENSLGNSAVCVFPGASSDAFVSQLQEELATIKCESSKLEMEKELQLRVTYLSDLGTRLQRLQNS